MDQFNRVSFLVIRRSLGACLALALAGSLTACGGDEREETGSSAGADPSTPAVSSPSTVEGSSGVPDAGCAEVLPATAVAALGWEPTEPLLDNDRCVVEAEGGRITLGTRALVGSGPDAAESTFDEECRDRDLGAPDVGFLPAGTKACGQVLGESGTGVAEVLLVTDDADLVQIRIETVQPIAAAAVEAALTELVGAANVAY